MTHRYCGNNDINKMHRMDYDCPYLLIFKKVSTDASRNQESDQDNLSA